MSVYQHLVDVLRNVRGSVCCSTWAMADADNVSSRRTQFASTTGGTELDFFPSTRARQLSALESCPLDIILEITQWLDYRGNRRLSQVSRTLRSSVPVEFQRFSVVVRSNNKRPIRQLGQIREAVSGLILKPGARISQLPVLPHVSTVLLTHTFGPEPLTYTGTVTRKSMLPYKRTRKPSQTEFFPQLERFFAACSAERLYLGGTLARPFNPRRGTFLPLYMMVPGKPHEVLRVAGALNNLSRLTLGMGLERFCRSSDNRPVVAEIPDNVSVVDCLMDVVRACPEESDMQTLYKASLGRLVDHRRTQDSGGSSGRNRSSALPVLNVYRTHWMFVRHPSSLGPDPPTGYKVVSEPATGTIANEYMDKIPSLWLVRLVEDVQFSISHTSDTPRKSMLLAPSRQEGEDGEAWLTRCLGLRPGAGETPDEVFESLHQHFSWETLVS